MSYVNIIDKKCKKCYYINMLDNARLQIWNERISSAKSIYILPINNLYNYFYNYISLKKN